MRRKLNRIENKRGFTLIELIAVIFIMGIMLILALPQVSKIQQANKNKKYETYEKSIERGAKLYTDSNAKDMFGNNNSGCVTIPYSALKSSNVIKDFGDNDIICSVDSESYVQIRKINDDYRYDVALTCRQDGEVVYQETVDNTFTCTNSPDTEVPEIEANPSSKDWVRPQDLEITIKISDESGLNRNTSIKYYWVKTSGEKVGKEYTHNYNNKKGVTKVSYKIPKKNIIDTTGQYYLVVEPYRTTTANGVQDVLGNDRITEERFGIYKIDNTKPSCGVADGEKTKWTNTDFTITQHCSDGESGCVKESYSKKFTESTTTHTFTIKDKAGNTNKCKVNVYLDKDKPTCGKTKGESTEWTNKDRTISVECEEKEFSKCKKDVFEVTFSTDGKKDNIEIQDNAGNKTQCSVNKYIDKTPPKCPTISSTTPAGKWTNKDITYTFKFTDDTAKYIWYTKTGDNDWKEWSTNKPSVTQKSITAEGYRKVGVRVYDAVGNHQLCGTDATYNIDKSKPTCGTASGSSTTWINKDRYISQGCNDSLSGCSAPTFNKTFTTEGTTDKISIADKAGNSNTCTVNKYIDKTRPTLGYKLTQDTTGQPYKSGTWTRNGVFRDLYPADKGGSGVLETQYNLGGGWDHEPNLSNFYIGEGNQTGRYRVKDNAGNYSDEVVLHFMIDWTAPNCVSSGGSSTATIGPVTITGICSDSNSGCTGNVSKTFTKDMNEWVSPGTVRDHAGNTKECPTQQVNINTRPNKPTIQNPTNEKWVNYNFALTVKTTSPSSIIGYWQYSYDNSSWTTYANSATNNFVTTNFERERNQLAYIRVCSKSGLCSDSASTYIRIDKTKPTLGYKFTKESDGQPYTSGTWTNSTIVRDLYPKDNASGVKDVQYNDSNTGWHNEPNLSGFKITEKDRISKYRARDNAGNYSDEVTMHYMIDQTPPVVESFDYQYSAPDAICNHGSTATDPELMVFRAQVYNVRAIDPISNGARSDIESFQIILAPSYWVQTKDGKQEKLQCSEPDCLVESNPSRYKFFPIYTVQDIGNWYRSFPRTEGTAQVKNDFHGNTNAFCTDWCINVVAIDKAGNGQQSADSWGTGTECPKKYNNSAGY